MCRSPERVNASRSRARASSSARGVVRAQHPGQGGLGVMGGHRDGVGEQLASSRPAAGRPGGPGVVGGLPPPQRGQPDPEPGRDRHRRGDSGGHQLHRGQPATTSSSVANADVACPNTNTAPPSAPSTRPAAGPIGVASAGSSGGGWRTRPTLPPPKYRTTVPVVIAGRWRITALRHAKSPAQKASPAQPDTSMSGVLGSGGVGADVPELDEQVARVLGSEDVVPVLYGRDPVTGGSLPGHAQREPRYTTRAQLALEASVLDGIDRRRGDVSGVVPDALIDVAIAGGAVRLGEDQDRAVRGLLADRNGVAVLIAPAGAGKTTSIGVARAGWEAAGLKVEGCAPTAKAAAELGDRGGMPTHTCAQVLAYDQRKAGMPAGGVMVIDEAGMLGTRDLARLLKAADNAHTKVILVGDPSQLQPISAGGLLRGIATQVGAQELTANRRQQQRLDRDALARMRAGEGAAAIDRLVAEGRVMAGGPRQPGPGADDRADERGRTGTEPARAGDRGSRGSAERAARHQSA